MSDPNKVCGLVCYEISRKTGLRNPSAQLHRCAVRIDGSVWEFPLARQAQVERALARYKKAGATVEYRIYDEKEFGRVQARATVCLEKEVNRIRESLDASLVRGRLAMEEAEQLQSAKKTKQARRFLKATIAKAKRELRHADECALVFDITRDVSELFQALASEVASRHDEFFAKTTADEPDDVEADGDDGELEQTLKRSIALARKRKGGGTVKSAVLRQP